MAEVVADKEKVGAVVYDGTQEAHEKAIELLEQFGLPGGLLPLEDVYESGYVKETGFVWIKQKKKTEHLFKLAGKLVAYAEEIRCYVGKNKLRGLVGVKAKELFLWVSIVEMSLPESPTGKIFFKSSAGIGKSFPVEAFARGQ